MGEEAQGASSAPRRASSDFSIERILAKDTRVDSTLAADASSSSGSDVTATTSRACTSFLDRKFLTVAHPTFTSAFVVQNKLDWLRNFCESQPTASTRVTQTDEDKANVPTINSTVPIKQTDTKNLEQFNAEELSWLRCTRYCPPKLPRKSSAGKNLKRKPGSHPRIPFTKYQLEVLEDKYKTNAYLTRKDVVYLSDLLHLPQSRIKIWFQNRRARARRESQSLDQMHATTM